MSTYVIGDIHGCYEQFIKLLKKINYRKDQDKIILLGDLVNRGPDSLSVLKYCIQDPSITSVLGNHDFYLLYLMNFNETKDNFSEIAHYKNSKKIFKWLIERPLMLEIFDSSNKNTFFITHAGVPEIWSPNKAKKLALEVSIVLKKNPYKLLKNLWGDHPKQWDDELKGIDRYRIIINYLTRMRFVGDNCMLDFKNTSSKPSKGFKPWFDYENKSYKKNKQFYIFGHWASLNGQTGNSHFIGLDTGCVWKGRLTAIRLDDFKRISVNY